jgi:hypothetical protein
VNRLDQLRQKAQEFHDDHPEVWDLFVRFTFDRIERGWRRYSADAIMHRVRWETCGGRPEANGRAPFKINDHHVTFYARRFMKMYPQHDGFFQLREQLSEHRPPLELRAEDL